MPTPEPVRLPTYQDDEVECFHPFFQYAALRALSSLNLEPSITVVHHKDINGTTVDFSFERTESQRIVLLVEIKRTPSDVSSIRSRLQALGYRQEADAIADTPYYVVTNLELADIFKYSSERPRVASQVVLGSPYRIGSFKETPLTEFIISLERFIKGAVEIALNDKGEYQENLDKLGDALTANISSVSNWHKILMPISYEYIRGASDHYPVLKEHLKQAAWEAADRYKSYPVRLREKGLLVDFENIFKDPLPEPNHPVAFDSELLKQGHKSGNLRAKGDDLAGLVQELLEKNPEASSLGVVETDDELARLLAICASDALDRSLIADDVVCDPAAGTGRLLTAAHSLAFQNLQPRQCWANEVNPFLVDPLCLRVGLDHATALCPGNVPRITLSDIVNLNPSDFSNVKVVLMNPPFLSGVRAKNEKRSFAEAIERVMGRVSCVNVGQIGLEALFLELVWALVPEGAVIAAILPFQILSRKSKEMRLLRGFLVEKFGLTHLISYPREGLFEKVIKRTFVAVGRKNFESAFVKCIDVRLPLERVDYDDLRLALQTNRISLGRSASLKIRSKQELQSSTPTGWRIGGVLLKADEWVRNNLSTFRQLGEIAAHLKRGKSGTSGYADLCCMKPNGSIAAALAVLIPTEWLQPSINNSNNFPKRLTLENRQTISPLPPARTWEPGSPESVTLDNIINEYLRVKGLQTVRRRAQRVAPLNAIKARKSIHGNVQVSHANGILIPRACRVSGRIGVLETPYVVSTNFIVVDMLNFEDALLTASWLASVFSQIQMEALSNNQEGMRKLERQEIAHLYIPDFSGMPNELRQSIIQAFLNDPPINLQRPLQRNLDTLWFQYIFPVAPTEFLRETFTLMADLCEERAF